MPIAGIILLGVYTVICALALFVNRDPFSPLKFFLLSLGPSFADIFFSEYELLIYVVYLSLLLTILVAVLAESLVMRTQRARLMSENIKRGVPLLRSRHQYGVKYHIFCWLLLLPAFIAQVYLIAMFGGIEGYINIIGMRVIEFRGLGPILTVIGTYSLVILVYFALIITKEHCKKWEWLLFLIPFTVMIAMGLLTGSRGRLLGPLVIMIVIFHYFKRPIKLKFIVIFGLIFLILSSIIEVARSGYQYTNSTFRTGLATKDKSFGIEMFKYGLIPLKLVLETDSRKLHYGKTYLTAVTNFVPRAFWPNKPDTGGVILTKEYTGDAWEGASNLSTGLIAEAVINFGIVGILIGCFFLLFLTLRTIKAYYHIFSTRRNRGTLDNIISFLIYYLVFSSFTSLIVGEFTHTVVGLIINVVVIVAIGMLLKKAFHKSRPRFLSKNSLLCQENSD